MKLYHTAKGIIIQQGEDLFLHTRSSWDVLVNRENLYLHLLEELSFLRADAALVTYVQKGLLPPIGGQEVWASGVTYRRKQRTRIEEARRNSGDFYAHVYEARRPELFFKATPAGVVGSGSDVHISRDSNWNVPEPELTVFVSSIGSIEGYTIGNDMSSRDVEGENPLYLPQAKSYDVFAALGPCLYVPGTPIAPETMIQMHIFRGGKPAFSAEIAINRMKRKHQELVDFLFGETLFPQGVYLMTGTGIVPPDEFTLQPSDEIFISIDGIGTLANTVCYR